MSYNINLALRLGLLTLTLCVLVWALQRGQLWITSACLAIFVAIQLWQLYLLLGRTQRQLEQFFDALVYEDCSTKMTAAGEFQRELLNKMNIVQQRLQDLRRDKETLLRYHQVMLEKVPVAIVVVEADERIELVNSSARKLFQRNGFTSLASVADYGEQLLGDLRGITAGQKLRSVMQINCQPISVSLSATQFISDGSSRKIISLQPIQRELDERELRAWQDLVQVFTHEIMNSMTPVVSLSNTASQLLSDPQLEVLDDGKSVMADARQAIAAVARRAEHLMDFVQAYRQITQVPVLNVSSVALCSLLDDVCHLFRAQGDAAIAIKYDVQPEDLMAHLDCGQIEQALINLLKNACEALVGNDLGCIHLSAYIAQDGNLVIDVSDNGPGIAPEKYAQIFVPFFTSKPKGTGVGLFVVKQIMQAHRGSVNALASESGGALFRLVF